MGIRASWRRDILRLSSRVRTLKHGDSFPRTAFFCIILHGFVSAEGGLVVLSYFRVRAEDDLNI